MRILMISTDKRILEDGSAAQRRHFEYAKICDSLDIVVLGNNSGSSADYRLNTPLAPLKVGTKKIGNVRVYGVRGKNKISRLWNGYKKAKAIMEGEENKGMSDVSPQSPSGKAARARNIDLVITQDMGFTGLIGYFLKKKYGMRLNIQIHGKEEKLLNKILLFPFQKQIIKSADSIRVVSERLKRMVVEKYLIAEKKIYVVPIYSEMVEKLRNSPHEIEQAISRGKEIKKLAGVEGDSHTEGDCHRNRYRQNQFTILTVGRLVKVKNIKLQIEALADVVKIFPDTRLVIVGEGPEKENLQKLAKRLKVEDKVEFAGWVAHDNGPSSERVTIMEKSSPAPLYKRGESGMAAYYRNADLFVLASNDEGWGMVIIEAMAAGLPVIMTNVGCAGEVVKNGENGIVIRTGDRKALIAAICDMIADVDKRNKFSKNGKMIVDNLPDKQGVIKMYREMWDFRN